MGRAKKKGKKGKKFQAPQTPDSDVQPIEGAENGQADASTAGEPDEAMEYVATTPKRKGAGAKVGGLSIYKPGQGYYTRVGTALFAAVLIAGLGNYLYGLMELWEDPDQVWTIYLRIGVPLIVCLAVAYVVYWLVGKKPGTCDFLILTEGEMKKVSWSSKKEIIGSTYVVIFVVLAMGALLAAADLAFATFFWAIDVLEKGPFG